MRKRDRFQFSNFAEVFGAPLSVYRVKRGFFESVVIPGLIFFLFLGGVIAYSETRDIWAIPVCVLPPLLLFGGLVRQIFSTRKDELRIYERGFTYRGGKSLYVCPWDEIKLCHRRERNEREITELDSGVFPLGSIEKKSGEIIEFETSLPGTPEIVDRLEKYRSSRRKRRKN